MSDAQESREGLEAESVTEKKPRRKWSYYSRKKLSRTRKRLIAEGAITRTTGPIVNINGKSNGNDVTKPIKEKQDITQAVRNKIRKLKAELRMLEKFQESLKETGIAELLQ